MSGKVELGKRKTGKPYIWVTWITKLLSGEERCWWRSWVKAHYAYEKVQETVERRASLDDWTKKHDGMVDAREAELKGRGLLTKKEDEGEVLWEGSTAQIAAKPDVVGLDADAKSAFVYDQKSGRKRTADKWQVRIYMLALADSWLKGWKIRGFVEYQDGVVEVAEPTAEQRAEIGAAVRKLASDDEPARTPSANDCKYCEIAACPDRVTRATGRTSSF